MADHVSRKAVTGIAGMTGLLHPSHIPHPGHPVVKLTVPFKVPAITGLEETDVSRMIDGIAKDYPVYHLMRVRASLGKEMVIDIIDTHGDRGSIYIKDDHPPEAAP
jgi:hypothetical protein